MIGSNLDTCKRGPPLIKLMGYEYWEDAVGGGGAGNGKHTHAHSVRRYTQEGWSIGQRSDAILTHVSVACPLIKLMGYENRENAVYGWGCRQRQINTNIHTTHSVPHDTQGGWRLGQ